MDNTKQITKHSEHIDFKPFKPPRHKKKSLRTKHVFIEPVPDEIERVAAKYKAHLLAHIAARDKISELPPGVDRRAAILHWLDNYALDNEVMVNRQYCLDLNDPDLRWLLKHGVLTKVRYGRPQTRITYLKRKPNED